MAEQIGDRLQGEVLLLDRAALESLPGPALLLGRDRRIAANRRGQAFLEATAGAAAPALIEIVSKALESRNACYAPVPSLRGTEALVLPLAEGAQALVIIHDDSLALGLREALIESRQRYKDLTEISSDFVWETDEGGRFVFVSPQGALGWSADQLIGHHPGEFLPETNQESIFVADVPLQGQELWFRRASGGTACLGVAATPVLDAAGKRRGTRGVCRDLTEERERSRSLAHARLRDRLLTHLVRAIRDEVEPGAALATAVTATGLALGAAGGIVLRRCGDSMIEAAGWGTPAQPALLESAREALAREDKITVDQETWLLIGHAARYRQKIEGAILLWRERENGDFPEQDRALLAEVADQLGVAIMQVANHESIVALSRSDPLTGLLNRRAFFEEMERRLRRAERGARTGALFYLDMDNFKLVNDVRGHAAGDGAILALCRILRDHTRSGDLVARLGGDEFVLWIEDISGATARERAEAILSAARVLAPLTGDSCRPLGVSLGLAVLDPNFPETPTQLVARADAAMYQVKQAGKGNIAAAPPARVLPP